MADKQPYKIPLDIVDVDQQMGNLISELPDTMIEPVRDWRSELRGDYRIWKAGGEEPNWQSYREEMNIICREDGMPDLFTE